MAESHEAVAVALTPPRGNRNGSSNDSRTIAGDSLANSDRASRSSSPCSPLIQTEKSSVDAMPTSPTSAADVFVILDEQDLGGPKTNATKQRGLPSFALHPSFLDSVPSLFDDDSLFSSDDESSDDEEELLGLSFVDNEEQFAP